MTHRPIEIHNIGLSFGKKACFEGFCARIHPGQRIAICGANGQGKSMLLKIIQGLAMPSEGSVTSEKVVFGYVPQTIVQWTDQSGGQRFQRALSQALALDPDVLCLDEPTNHLDQKNRRSLMGLLDGFKKTLLVVSHDKALLRSNFDTLWHIQENRVYQFSGRYDDFMAALKKELLRREMHKNHLRLQKSHVHEQLMVEQARAKKKRLHGEKKYDGDKLALRSAQGRGQMTMNKNKRRIGQEKELVINELAQLKLPEVIKVNFSIEASKIAAGLPAIAIVNGSCGYNRELLCNIDMQINHGERWAIVGPNGCGKSTLLKAIMSDIAITRSGTWLTPNLEQIGYLDQHYQNFDPELSPLEIISRAAPSWSMEECRLHLNNFLFRKNEEVSIQAGLLSGGEKARLSLAKLAAHAPSLILLDEVTNNMDLATRDHLIQVLKAYRGALLVVSHDEDFLEEINASIQSILTYT